MNSFNGTLEGLQSICTVKAYFITRFLAIIQLYVRKSLDNNELVIGKCQQILPEIITLTNFNSQTLKIRVV